jgi:hypothetical protein
MDDRLETAEAFLAEAVFASRARQAAGVSLLKAGQKDGSSPSNCGLGAAAAVELELSPRGRELYGRLWSAPPDAAQLTRIRAALTKWVERQDALDRERNHFLKAFRGKHGADRRAYSTELQVQFDSGLARVNENVVTERRAAALELLG